MPWRGPREQGEYPTLGWEVGTWVQEHCVIPDGYRLGEPYLLTDEMWSFLLRFYRVYVDAAPWPAERGLRYYGGQLRRSQKWGKDPFGAAIILAEAFGPARFDGWDAGGEPVGAPYPTPYIPCLGTSEDQTDNTYRPLLEMVRRGPLADLVRGIEPGETKVTWPGGTIEPVTASARARLGGRVTFATFTETHLWAGKLLRRLGSTMKRNIAGMDGRWLELTNAWDPNEQSEAQATSEARGRRVLLDTVEPRRVEDLRDDEALVRELRRQYGDSVRDRGPRDASTGAHLGGWVNLGRIVDDVRNPTMLEADRRRFFLNEIVVGESLLVDPFGWDRRARPGRPEPGDALALGFDGSKYRDATALVGCRMSDGRLFELRVWERPPDALDWQVPTAEVDRVVRDVFDVYRVTVMFADPYRWQSYLDAWAADHMIDGQRSRVIEFPTNRWERMDRAVERFLADLADGHGGLTHDGSAVLARHFKDAVLVKGARRKPRPGEDEGALSTHYLGLGKRHEGALIDAAVAGVLANAARGHAVERGITNETVEPWGFYR